MDIFSGLFTLPPTCLYGLIGAIVVWLLGFLILFVITGGSFPDDAISCCIAPFAIVLLVVLCAALAYFGFIWASG